MKEMFISEQCFDLQGLDNKFWNTMLDEDLDHWWIIGVEGHDYFKFYCCL